MIARRVVQLFAALCLLSSSLPLTVPSAYALDALKTAEALAQRAAKAFEAGNMTEAGALYREAYKMAPSQSAYLYGAARASHTGRDLAHAEADYVAFLALANADPARVQKAKGYLESLRAELSVEKMADAKKAEAAGDALLATTFYLEAWRMAPDRAEPLLKAAILERQLGDKKAAVSHLQRYLQLAPMDAGGRATAEVLLKQLGGTPVGTAPPKPVPVVTPVPVETPKPVVQPRVEQPKSPAEQPKPSVAKPQPAVVAPQVSAVADKPMSTRRVVGWSAIGVGGAAVIGAGILAVLASGQQSTLNGNKNANGHFDATRISVDQAASEQTSINGKWTGMGIAAGVGVAAIGVGAWLVAGAPADVAVVPTWDGFSIAGRF